VTGVPPVEATSVRLAPPSPNPSSRLTEFAFTVSRDGLVRLEVFDLKGRRVSTIVNGWRPSGAAHASWDGLRDDGTIAAAGVYFVRLSDSGAPGESRPFLRSR
jgi:flagellar hook assembly protein FlgD